MRSLGPGFGTAAEPRPPGPSLKDFKKHRAAGFKVEKKSSKAREKRADKRRDRHRERLPEISVALFCRSRDKKKERAA